MTTTRVEQLSDGEELVIVSPETHMQPDCDMDPRDRIIGHRSAALAAESGVLSRERRPHAPKLLGGE